MTRLKNADVRDSEKNPVVYSGPTRLFKSLKVRQLRWKLEIVLSKLDNISPYSNGMPGASLNSTSVDPSQTRKELKDGQEQKIGGVDIWGLLRRRTGADVGYREDGRDGQIGATKYAGGNGARKEAEKRNI